MAKLDKVGKRVGELFRDGKPVNLRQLFEAVRSSNRLLSHC